MQLKYMVIGAAAALALSVYGQAAKAGAVSPSGAARVETQAATQQSGSLTLVHGGWGHGGGWGRGGWGRGGWGWGWGGPFFWGAPYCYPYGPYCGYGYGYYGGPGLYGYRRGWYGHHGVHMHHHHK
ncbi:MAG: hypothetical protein WAK07_03150 [Rhodomicrobium sp.]